MVDQGAGGAASESAVRLSDGETAAADYRVLLFYLYRPIADAETFLHDQRALCEALDLRGRILVADEGINGTVSGTRENTEAYRRKLEADPRTRGMDFKIEPCEGHVFPRLSVKLRQELVTLGLAPEEDVDPNQLTGMRLEPAAFKQMMEEPDVVLLDGRNAVESSLGRFQGAICPEVDHFRDFPEWIRDHREELEGKRILTYCTGGIRCEKLSGFLLRAGFEEVYQLNGGIIRYGQDETVQGRNFEGLCYVFDERIGVEVNRTEGRRVISRCERCGEASPRYRNCSLPSCNRQFILCEACERQDGDAYCDEACRSRAESSASPLAS